MTIQTNTQNRKALAQQISQLTGDPVQYMGVPSCAYQVGPYTILKDGSIEGEELTPIQDFLVENGGRRCLIRPSFNYIEGQLDGVRADVLFLGTAGLAKADTQTEARFFAETVDKVRPRLVVPLHWDNFFSPLTRPARGMPRLIEKTEVALWRLVKACEARGIDCAVLPPRASITL